jgi:prolyl oligopeptidase
MRKSLFMRKSTFALFVFLFATLPFLAQNDPYLWLEEIDGEKALEFVEEQNKITLEKLQKVAEYDKIYDTCLEIYNSSDKIVYPRIYGDYVYNFWKDADHVRGIWRRSPKSEFLEGAPKWEILLDLDKMSKDEGIKWVYKGVSGLYPDYDRFLVSLSKGGGDAVVTKEFDANTKTFVADGFSVGESKGGKTFVDKNTVLISNDFGEGSMTPSGYPRQVKVWKRGSPLEDAELIFECKPDNVSAGGYVLRDGSRSFTILYTYKTIFTSERFVWDNNKAIKLDIPDDSSIELLQDNQLVLDLKSDWTVNGKTFNSGSIVGLNFNELMEGNQEVQLILEPDEFSSVTGISSTKNKMIVNLLSNVSSELHIYDFDGEKWNSKKVDAPELGTISVIDTDEFSDQYFFEYANFLTPSTVFLADAGNGEVFAYKSLPSYFDDSKYEVHQYKSKSKDGTLVPYFVAGPKDMKLDGTNPTLVYAYGGYQVPILPFYSGTFGTSWLENGGVFVLANIRGGGEYGPKWHQAGLKEKRQNVFDDFYSVAEDLIQKKITSSSHLGAMGGSNGGLLVGVAFTQRPDLYNAVVCQVPLLDMQRYNKLLAGASWMGEYGDPDIPEEWAYIKKYSPYHNLKEGVDYPEVFFYTSTRDDRVHPGHARKMAAKMIDMGDPVLYYENTEGGHAGSSTNDQSAKSSAMTFSYLLMKLR